MRRVCILLLLMSVSMRADARVKDVVVQGNKAFWQLLTEENMDTLANIFDQPLNEIGNTGVVNVEYYIVDPVPLKIVGLQSKVSDLHHIGSQPNTENTEIHGNIENILPLYAEFAQGRESIGNLLPVSIVDAKDQEVNGVFIPGISEHQENRDVFYPEISTSHVGNNGNAAIPANIFNIDRFFYAGNIKPEESKKGNFKINDGSING